MLLWDLLGEFPGTDYESFNYDWVIGKLKELKDSVAAALASEEAAAESASNASGAAGLAMLYRNAAKDFRDEAQDSAEDAAADAQRIEDSANQIAANTARIDNLVAHAGDTSENSELLDIRIGYDGETYSTAGDAVRDQIEDLHTVVDNMTSYRNLYTGVLPGAVDGYALTWQNDNNQRAAVLHPERGTTISITASAGFNRFWVFGKQTGDTTYTSVYRVAPADVEKVERYVITNNAYDEIVVNLYYGSAYPGGTVFTAYEYEGATRPTFTVNGVDVVTQEEADHVYWENKLDPPYWVLHVDCARKFISVDNMKLLIDNIAAAGFNQLQLHFSEDTGFRFSLQSMIFDSEDGHRYDLANALGGTESPNNWYSQQDMDTIIYYARGKNIDVVPSLDMPGHMGRILSIYPEFKYNNSTTLDVTNEQAVYFAEAIVKKYANYFMSRGCKFWNIGFDEIVNSNGFETFYNNNEFHYLTSFANRLATLIIDNGLKPRIYNEVVYYRDNYNEYIDKNIEVYYWTRTNVLNAYSDQLQIMGYKLINNSYSYYWVLGVPTMQVTPAQLADTYLLSDFFNNTPNRNGYGAVLSIWCDLAASVDAGDGGNSIVTDTATIIAAFGDAITRAMTE